METLPQIYQDSGAKSHIVYDKFHVMTYLGDALDEVRRLEFLNTHAEDRRLIKGQRYTLLSRRANLDEKKERALALLLKANRRLNTAYLMKESFVQLWDCEPPREARDFFDRWRPQLRWRRLEPLEKFTKFFPIFLHTLRNRKIRVGRPKGRI